MPERGEINTALLISGEGTTAEAVIQACQRGEIKNIRPVVVMASRRDARGLARAEALGIPTEVVAWSDYKGQSEAFGGALLTRLRHHRVDLVSQNGWLPKTPPGVIEMYSGKIINQHPGRLPAFGGKGMFGPRVTCATLAYFALTGEEDPWTASVVHHVTPEFDSGQVIQERRLAILAWEADTTIDDLRRDPRNLLEQTICVQGQLLSLEHSNVISVLSAFGEGKVPTAELDTTSFQKNLLQAAKGLAVQLYP